MRRRPLRYYPALGQDDSLNVDPYIGEDNLRSAKIFEEIQWPIVSPSFKLTGANHVEDERNWMDYERDQKAGLTAIYFNYDRDVGGLIYQVNRAFDTGKITETTKQELILQLENLLISRDADLVPADKMDLLKKITGKSIDALMIYQKFVDKVLANLDQGRQKISTKYGTTKSQEAKAQEEAKKKVEIERAVARAEAGKDWREQGSYANPPWVLENLKMIESSQYASGIAAREMKKMQQQLMPGLLKKETPMFLAQATGLQVAKMPNEGTYLPDQYESMTKPPQWTPQEVQIFANALKYIDKKLPCFLHLPTVANPKYTDLIHWKPPDAKCESFWQELHKHFAARNHVFLLNIFIKAKGGIPVIVKQLQAMAQQAASQSQALTTQPPLEEMPFYKSPVFWIITGVAVLAGAGAIYYFSTKKKEKK